jgi:hypothetical protein
MSKKLQNLFTTTFLFFTTTFFYSQAPDLGVTTNFVLFSTDGAVSNTGISQLTGKVGTNNGSNTGFGNVNGGMHAADETSAQAATDLLIAYNQLFNATANFFPAPLIGNGSILNAGIYAISGASTLSGSLILDAQNNPNAVFIFKIAGPLSTNANSKIKLINGAQACNVFWKVEGLVDMAAGTTMRGTVIANNAGINMNAGDTLEGRLLTTAGAITIDGVLAFTPSGCGSIFPTGPAAPYLGAAGCYGIFSSDGPVENAGITHVIGDVGANVGLTTGFDPLLISGTIHLIPNVSTAQAAADLLIAYTYLNGLVPDIELLYPAQFGGNLVLTPHTYVLNGGTTFTDTIYLNAQGISEAVFVIKIYGALETSTFSNVVLINGTQAKNVYWLVNGAVDINDNSIFNGSIISQGAINLYTGVEINGRALTAVGAISTNAINGVADIDVNCQSNLSLNKTIENKLVTIYPNPFVNSITIDLDNVNQTNNIELNIYSILGEKIMTSNITSNSTDIDVSMLSSGVYFYTIVGDNQLLNSGKLISQ